jgi:hypothetical protein
MRHTPPQRHQRSNKHTKRSNKKQIYKNKINNKNI